MSTLLKIPRFETQKFIGKEGFSLLEPNLDIEDDQTHELLTRRKLSSSVVLHIILIILYTIIAFTFVYTKPFSPAQESVSYESVTINTPLEDKNPFKGEPRQELEDAWYNILKYQNIRVTKEELDLINRTSVPLNDAQGGYLANLDVFHELHCLNIIREHVYREFYPDQHSLTLQRQHVDHCIDTLRQTAMCHADISLLTYTWIDDYRWPWPNFDIAHECRSWEKVLEWTKGRYVERLLGPIVRHPVLGDSWREDEKNETHGA
ncbi:hypothetical protein NHQ30_010872 [Ciborinia camelliae]|nr:hypothetical protein NHQ30_010872 [Ciborinia camelliae]